MWVSRERGARTSNVRNGIGSCGSFSATAAASGNGEVFNSRWWCKLSRTFPCSSGTTSRSTIRPRSIRSTVALPLNTNDRGRFSSKRTTGPAGWSNRATSFAVGSAAHHAVAPGVRDSTQPTLYRFA